MEHCRSLDGVTSVRSVRPYYATMLWRVYLALTNGLSCSCHLSKHFPILMIFSINVHSKLCNQKLLILPSELLEKLL